MTWRVIVSDLAWADLDRLTADDRAAVEDELARWVDTGPPMRTIRRVRQADIYEDLVSGDVVVTYFVEPTGPYAAVLRVRRSRP